MSLRERYDATLAFLGERLSLADEAWADGPDDETNWLIEESDVLAGTDLSEVARRFIAAHDPATMLRVYGAAAATLRSHGPDRVQMGSETHGGGPQYGNVCRRCGFGRGATFPCPDALRIMDVWLPE